MNRGERGFALILVIWSLVLLTSLATGFALAVRQEIRVAGDMAATARAEAAASAALHAAVMALITTDREVRWRPDASVHQIPWPDARLTVQVKAESGRIDLNRAPRELILGLLAQFIPAANAEALADAVIDWRDADDEPEPAGAERDAYERAGYGYGPANGAFNSVGEINRVIGFDDRLTGSLRPYLTVYSRRPRINAVSAELVVLLSVPGMDRETAGALMAQRERIAAEGGRMDMSAFPSGRRYLESRSNESVLSLEIDVRMEDGLRRREHAVVQLRRARGYTLLLRETRPVDPATGGAAP